MKPIKHFQNGTTIWEHNGVTFRCTAEAIADALYYQGLDLYSYLEKTINILVQLNAAKGLSVDFSVRCRITKDPVGTDEIAHTIQVIKIPRIEE